MFFGYLISEEIKGVITKDKMLENRYG
jgi:hypothetical protein